MKRVLVTGASGFIGRHVTAALRTTGHDVMAVTRRAECLDVSSGLSRIFQHDLTALPANPYKALGRPDVLIHLAWDGLPNYKALRHFETEAPLQYSFIKSMIQGGLPRVLVAGTCLEYGLYHGALSESLLPKPIVPYGLAKDILRRQLEALQETESFQLAWCRLFFMFGPGQAPSSLFSLLKAAAERGDRSFPMSGGEQLRDFLPVEQAAEYLVKLALLDTDSGIVNVCSGRPISIRGLVETWLRKYGWSLDLELGRYPYPDYESMAFWGDPTRLSSLLNGL